MTARSHVGQSRSLPTRPRRRTQVVVVWGLFTVWLVVASAACTPGGSTSPGAGDGTSNAIPDPGQHVTPNAPTSTPFGPLPTST
jgi:hypothetical protein